MANMILLAFTFASLVSGAAMTPSLSERFYSRTLKAFKAPCPNHFAPFTYKGCYEDSGDRSLMYVPQALDKSRMTPEYCQSACKGK